MKTSTLPAAVATGLPLLLAKIGGGGAWNCVPWSAHLWWLRFFVAARHAIHGTRHEDLGEWPWLARILRWWLTHTSDGERVRFFADPDLDVAMTPARSVAMPPAWRSGLRRLARLVPAVVLEPIPLHTDEPSVLEYSPRRAHAVVRRTIQEQGEHGEVPAYHHQLRTVDDLITVRYGCDLAHVLDHGYAEEPFLRAAATHSAAPLHMRNARVRRYPRLGCAVLRVGPLALIAAEAADAVWRGCTQRLTNLLLAGTHVVFLDAPVGRRRAVYAAKRLGGDIQWLTGGPRSAILNWYAESEGSVKAQSVAHALRSPRRTEPRRPPPPPTMVVDGIDHCSPAQQNDLLGWLLSEPPRRLVLAGRCPAGGNTPWALFVHSARALGWMEECGGVGAARRRCWSDTDGASRLSFVAIPRPRSEPAPRVHHHPRPTEWLLEEIASRRIDPANTVLVVSGRAERERILRQLFFPSPPTGVTLLDGSPLCKGCAVRAVRITGDLVYGGVYRIHALSPGGTAVVLVPEDDPDAHMRLPLLDVANACVVARFAFLCDIPHHHYRNQSVVVLASRPTMRHLPSLDRLAQLGRDVSVVLPRIGDSTPLPPGCVVPDPRDHALWRDVLRFLRMLATDEKHSP